MDEQQGPPEDEGHAHARTGVEAVDQVLAEVDGLEGRPVAEHVAVFERAHEKLRRALDAPQEP